MNIQVEQEAMRLEARRAAAGQLVERFVFLCLLLASVCLLVALLKG